MSDMSDSNIEYIDDHAAYACKCGNVHFNLLKSGNIECSGCGERGLFVYGIPCPKCGGIDTGTRSAGTNSVADECTCEICHECGHEWNHR